MVEQLTQFWIKCTTRQLAKIFKNYMESLGVKKWDSRREDNLNTYLIDAKSTGWDRVQCYYYKDSHNYAEFNLLIVLRKKAGNYMIIQKGGTRAFEVDHRGLIDYDEGLLKEIMAEHKPLFNAMLSIVR